jgi:hypothetical protein
VSQPLESIKAQGRGFLALPKSIDRANLGLATAIDGWLSAKKASKMDQSVGTEKTGATLPTLRAELVKLPAGRELQIKFKTVGRAKARAAL